LITAFADAAFPADGRERYQLRCAHGECEASSTPFVIAGVDDERGPGGELARRRDSAVHRLCLSVVRRTRKAALTQMRTGGLTLCGNRPVRKDSV
jgi:hypothetical protein